MTGRHLTGRHTTDAERNEIERLLPWRVTGRLDRADMARVAAHLEHGDDDAREIERQIALIGEERAAVAEAHNALGSPSPDALARLMAAVAAEEERPAPRRTGPWRRLWSAIAGFFSAPPPSAVRGAFAAASVALLVQASVIAALVLKPKDHDDGGRRGFHLASGGDPAAAGGPAFLVVFTDGATAPAITSLLTEINATIVNGPNNGMYKIVVRAQRNGAQGNETAAPDPRELLRRISSRKDVVKLVLPGGS